MNNKIKLSNVLAVSVVGLSSMALYSKAQLKYESSIISKECLKQSENILEVVLSEDQSLVDLNIDGQGFTHIKIIGVDDKHLSTSDYLTLKELEIPNIDLSGIKSRSIPVSTFSNCTWLETFVFPQEIKDISQSAFARCTGLKGDLIIPDTVERIFHYAFLGCTGFNGELKLSNNLTSIGMDAFAGCTGLKGNLIIPDSLTSLQMGAFTDCTGFDGTLQLSKNLKGIEGNTFNGCRNLKGSLIIPDLVEYIGGNAFKSCIGFTGDLIIPDSVTSVGSNAFNGCTGFNENLELRSGLKEIGDSAFLNCSNIKGDLIIPNTVTSIKSNAFNGCTGFSGELVLSNTLEEIGNSAFQGCNKFSGDLIIPDLVTSIGNSAFNGCNGFNGDLTIGSSVASIGYYAFYECSGFTGDLIIPDSVETILDYAFTNCSGFDGVLRLSNSLSSIGQRAFLNCSNFTGDLIIPDSVVELGALAFKDCSNFDGDLVISDSLIILKDSVFENCSGFKGNLLLGQLLTTIGQRSFSGCSNLTGDIILPNSLEVVGIRAFANCSGFSGELLFGENLKTIEESAFNGCSGLKGDLVFPESLEYINYYAFYGCSGFDGDIFIGKNLKTIRSYAISDCYNVKNIFILTGEEFKDSDYRREVIQNINTNKLKIDISYNFNTSNTWLEDTSYTKIKPILTKISNGTEDEFDNEISEKIALEIPSPCYENDILVTKNDKPYELPTIMNGRYIFSETGIYQVYIKTYLGAESILKFEVDKDILQYTEAEDAIEEAINNCNTVTLELARDLINKLPEGEKKEQLQQQINKIFPDIQLDSKTASANLDIYIKSQNMLLLSLDTNSITFEDFNGVSDMLKDDAVEISINSSLPYNLNAYLMTEIQNSDKTNTMEKEILQLKEDSEIDYQYFENVDEKMILKSNCDAGNDKVHLVDFKLKGGIAHEKDIYKTVIKFEAEQK